MWNEGETSEEREQRQERRAKEVLLVSPHCDLCFMVFFFPIFLFGLFVISSTELLLIVSPSPKSTTTRLPTASTTLHCPSCEESHQQELLQIFYFLSLMYKKNPFFTFSLSFSLSLALLFGSFNPSLSECPPPAIQPSTLLSLIHSSVGAKTHTLNKKAKEERKGNTSPVGECENAKSERKRTRAFRWKHKGYENVNTSVYLFLISLFSREYSYFSFNSVDNTVYVFENSISISL